MVKGFDFGVQIEKGIPSKEASSAPIVLLPTQATPASRILMAGDASLTKSLTASSVEACTNLIHPKFCRLDPNGINDQGVSVLIVRVLSIYESALPGANPPATWGVSETSGVAGHSAREASADLAV